MTAQASGRSERTRIVRQILGAALILVLAWGMIYYYHGVLLRVRSARVQEPSAVSGTWSDLYPRWWGARELLWHHRNPYSAEVTAEIQRGFYGRPLNRSSDPYNPDRERDPEEFVYPVYIVFLLAPFLAFPFHAVGGAFTAFLLLLTPASLWLWMKALNLRLRPWAIALALIALMSSYPVVDGLHLQQLTLFVAALMAGAMAALARGRHALAGVLLALAMMKPQLAILTVALVLIWTLGNWRSRKWLAIAFSGVMVTFLVGAEIVLPGWFWLWRQAADSYVAHHKEALVVAVFHLQTAEIFGTAALGALFILFWHARKTLPASGPFNFALVAALVLTVMYLPNAGSSYYNEVLLFPVVLWMFTSGLGAARDSAFARIMQLLAAGVLAGEWIAALPVSLAVLVWHWHFERESTLFVTGPEFLIFYFPIFLGVFVLSAGPRAWRSA